MPKAKTQAATVNIHAVVGSDEAEVKRAASELAQTLTPPDAGDFGLETIDGVSENADQAAARIRSAIEALQTLPFFGSSKVVWLKNANFLGDTQRSLVKRAELQIFNRLDSSRSGWEEEAIEVVRRRAQKRKLQFDEDALDLFVLLTGGDTRQVENELEKIDLFLANGGTAFQAVPRVTADLVRKLVPLSRAGVIFELSNALATRDLELALRLVRRLLDQGENAVGILLVAILPTVRNLLLTKDLMERHRLKRPNSPFQFTSAINRLPAEATDHLPRKKDGSINAYPLGIAAQQAHRFETEQLVKAMQACLEANLKLVTTQLDHELVLTEAVVKLLG